MTDEVTPEATPEAAPEQVLLPIPVFDDKTLPKNAPRFYVHEDTLHATTGDNEKHEISLRVKARYIPDIEDLPSSLEQLQALASMRGEVELVDALDEMDIIDAREIARKFFQAFHEKEQARLGESFGSSTS